MNTSYAEKRAREAWEARINHRKASNTWAEVADELNVTEPLSMFVCEIHARWMSAYADADAAAERAFRELAVAMRGADVSDQARGRLELPERAHLGALLLRLCAQDDARMGAAAVGSAGVLARATTNAATSHVRVAVEARLAVVASCARGLVGADEPEPVRWVGAWPRHPARRRVEAALGVSWDTVGRALAGCNLNPRTRATLRAALEGQRFDLEVAR